MSKPEKDNDNINNPKQYRDNYQQLKRQKDCQNLQNHPTEPPVKIPRRSKWNTSKDTKTHSKTAYTVDGSLPKHCQDISDLSRMNATLPFIEESQLSIQNYDPELGRKDNRNKENTQAMTSGESEIRLDNTKVICKDTQLPLNVSNKELTSGQYTSVGVQVSPLPQYRLRFLPIGSCAAYTSSEWRLCGTKGIRLLLRLVGQWIFSQCGLGTTLFIWALLGAAAFRVTEGPYEEQVARELMGKQHELVVELAGDLRILKQEEPWWHNKIEYYVDKHKEMLLEAVSDGYGEGGSKGKIWSYAGCLLFAVSLLTTLGKIN
jgi:hypothetical protein